MQNRINNGAPAATNPCPRGKGPSSLVTLWIYLRIYLRIDLRINKHNIIIIKHAKMWERWEEEQQREALHLPTEFLRRNVLLDVLARGCLLSGMQYKNPCHTDMSQGELVGGTIEMGTTDEWSDGGVGQNFSLCDSGEYYAHLRAPYSSDISYFARNENRCPKFFVILSDTKTSRSESDKTMIHCCVLHDKLLLPTFLHKD